MCFLRVICLQPYLALVQATSHASLQYDPSKTDIRTSPAFAEALMRTILKFAVDNHLPQQARPPADKEVEMDTAGPASPFPAAPKQATKRRAAAMQTTTEEADPSRTEAGIPKMCCDVMPCVCCSISIEPVALYYACDPVEVSVRLAVDVRYLSASSCCSITRVRFRPDALHHEIP